MKCAETAHLVGAKTACACVSSMKKQPVITVTTTLTQFYTTVAIPASICACQKCWFNTFLTSTTTILHQICSEQ